MKTVFNTLEVSSIAEDTENNITSSLYELLAVYLVLITTSIVLVISSWSAIILATGNIETGGPIGFVMEMFISSGVL